MVRKWNGMVLCACILLGICAGHGTQAQAQAPSGTMEFEVASIRQNKTDVPERSSFALDDGNVYSTIERDYMSGPKGSNFSATNQPMWRYIAFAYELSGTQELALRFSYFPGLSSKAPAWLTGSFNSQAERFDIEARAERPSTKGEFRLMMQALLAERFKLVAHREKRDAPIFALTLAKAGKLGARIQLHPSSDLCVDEASTDEDKSKPAVPHSELGQLPGACGVIAHLPPNQPGHIRFGGRNVKLSLLATSLPTMTGMATIPRPVIDETGLSESYDFTLDWVPEFNAPPDASGQTFREALEKQLGLTLKPRNGAIDILVIDHVEHPSAN